MQVQQHLRKCSVGGVPGRQGVPLLPCQEPYQWSAGLWASSALDAARRYYWLIPIVPVEEAVTLGDRQCP